MDIRGSERIVHGQLWAFQTAATLNIDISDTVLLWIGSVLLNPFNGKVEFPVSFVHNAQAGYVMERYISQKKTRTALSTAALVAEVAGDLLLITPEYALISGSGLVAGALASWILRKI